MRVLAWRGVVCGLWGLLLVVVGLLVPAGAGAAQAHFYERSFGGVGEGAGEMMLVGGGPFEAGSGLAVNDETHDVYVADTGNARVDEFEADGTFVEAWGWGVLNGAAELQVCTVSCRKGLSGTGPGEFDVPVFVAVDNASGSASHGDVYVADAGQNLESPGNLVTKFTKTGGLVKSWGVEGQLNGAVGEPARQFGQLAGIAVGATGELWVYVGGTVQARKQPHV